MRFAALPLDATRRIVVCLLVCRSAQFFLLIGTAKIEDRRKFKFSVQVFYVAILSSDLKCVQMDGHNLQVSEKAAYRHIVLAIEVEFL